MMEVAQERRYPIAEQIIGWAEIIIGAVFIVLGGYLLLSPLYPQPGDVHGGLLGMFSGLFVMPLAATLLYSGLAMRRGHKLRWHIQLLLIILIAGVAVFLSQ